jgi:hypothetical protein
MVFVLSVALGVVLGLVGFFLLVGLSISLKDKLIDFYDLYIAPH